MKFEPKKLINGQSLIDFAIENYGCYEGLFLLLADNPDVVQAVSQILAPGTELRVRTPAPELTESNKTIVSQYIAQAVAVACGDCSGGSIQVGEATVDCTGALLTIPFTTEGLPEKDTLNLEILVDDVWEDADGSTTGDVSEIPINAPFTLPVSNTGAGIANGTYTIRFVSNATGVASNRVTFTVDCAIVPPAPSIHLNSVKNNYLSNNYSFDIGYEYADIPATDGFKLQCFFGGEWQDVNTSPITISAGSATGLTAYIQLTEITLPEDETRAFRIVNVTGDVVSNTLDVLFQKFVFLWAKSANESVDLDTPQSVFNLGNLIVEWGDGTIDTNRTHTYLSAGNFSVIAYHNDSNVVCFDSCKLLQLYALPSSLENLTIQGCADFSVIPTLPVGLKFLAISGLNDALPAIPPLPTGLAYVNFVNQPMSSDTIDDILAQLDANGVENGSCFLTTTGGNPPSSSGLVSKSNLEAKGWDVYTN